MTSNASSSTISRKWALSLARYEAAKLEATWLDRRLTIRLLPHAVKRLAALLAAGEVPDGSYKRLSPALWWRASAASRLKHWLG